MDEFRTLGTLKLSVAGVGCNNFGVRLDEASTREVVSAALDAGVTHFDTADIYGNYLSEEFLSRALASERERVVIGTKFGMMSPTGVAGGSRQWVQQAAEASLRRLNTDWIDLYTFHAPDPETPIVETLRALTELVAAGKVREIGCSNFSVEQLEEAAKVAAEEGLSRFVAVQNEYNVLEPNQDLLDACRRLDIGLVPFHPLARGFLTGKYRRGADLPAGTRLAAGPEEWREQLLNDVRFEQVERLENYASERGRTVAELAVAWVACTPAVISVIAGASTAGQVRANVAAATSWQLTAEERNEIAELAAWTSDSHG